MADQDDIPDETELVADEEMGEVEAEATAAAGNEDNEPTGLEDIEPDVPELVTFLEYGYSPLVPKSLPPCR